MILPAAVFWDMDGTLVDSEPLWFESQCDLAALFEVPWSVADALSVVGKDIGTSSRVLRRKGITLDPEEIGRRIVEGVVARMREGVLFRTGALEMLEELSRAGLSMALVTSSPRAVTDTVLEQLPLGTFLESVALEDVVNAKPHPEPYLRAAMLMGVDIGECVVFEDSVSGVASAVSSGALTIAVPQTADLTRQNGVEIWNGFQGRTAADLSALVESRKTRGGSYRR